MNSQGITSLEYLLVTVAGIMLFSMFFPGIESAYQGMLLSSEMQKGKTFHNSIEHSIKLLNQLGNGSRLSVNANFDKNWQFNSNNTQYYLKLEESNVKFNGNGTFSDFNSKLTGNFKLYISKRNERIRFSFDSNY